MSKSHHLQLNLTISGTEIFKMFKVTKVINIHILQEITLALERYAAECSIRVCQ